LFRAKLRLRLKAAKKKNSLYRYDIKKLQCSAITARFDTALQNRFAGLSLTENTSVEGRQLPHQNSKIRRNETPSTGFLWILSNWSRKPKMPERATLPVIALSEEKRLTPLVGIKTAIGVK